jgi:hypothetical protein
MLLRHASLVGCSDVAGGPGVLDAGEHDGHIPAQHATNIDAGMFVPLDAARLGPVIDNQGWRRFDAAVDPLRSHQPPTIECLPSATFVEYGSFEVDTTRCNYALSEHLAQRAVQVGSAVELELLHYDLIAPEPASAHLALLFGDALQWETTLPIPAPGGLVKASFRATRALSVGDPIRLHLHNHGGNTYVILSLEAAVSP